MMKEHSHRLHRRRDDNLFIQIINWFYNLFIREKFCFVILGFAFGVLLTRCVEWLNYESNFHVIEAPTYVDMPSRHIITEKHDILTNNISHDTSSTSKPMVITKQYDNTLLNGLQIGMDLIGKNPRNPSKTVQIVYIVGNEGSGHHLWENIMKEMSKHSKMVNADYIDNNVILVECLHSCFMEIYHKKKAKLETQAERDYFEAAQKKTSHGLFVEYSCNALVVELEKLVKNDDILPDGALLYLRSFSYPFMGVDLYKIPNVVTLINYMQQIIEIDIKLIVMKREWVNCVVSACVHRYGDCINRVQMQPAILSMIQSQLLSIDPAFWIMIDYEDFVSRPLEYVDIISNWLLIKDKELIQNALEDIVKASKTSKKKSGWKELKKNAKSLAGLVQNLLYSDYSKNMWPIYNSPYFTVTPENRGFLDSKYK